MEVKSDQGEVLDDCFHVTSALGAFRFGSKGHVITIASFFRSKLH